MASPQANPPTPALAAVDNATAHVLAALDTLTERLGAVEALLRDSRSPTATMHALYALEEATVQRIRGMSEVMNLILGRVGSRLAELSQEEGGNGMSPEDILTMVSSMSAAPPRPTPGRKVKTKKTRGT